MRGTVNEKYWQQVSNPAFGDLLQIIYILLK